MSSYNFKKIFNWEYWPSYMFYIPNLPYATYLALRAKNLVFFSATNPAIKHSGNGTESKFATLELIPEQYKPVSIFIKAKSSKEVVLKKIDLCKLNFPLIIKPDIGYRGLLVEIIRTKSQLLTYLKKQHYLDLIIQEYISYKNECGIFYHKIPGESFGKITSLTLKEYLSVTGDGKSTIEKLIANNKRAQLYIPLLDKLQKDNYNLILNKDEKYVLNTIGNHSKGTKFINGNNLISKKLEQAIDTVFTEIPNCYYGRIDLKYNSIEDIIDLKNFKILEINGIISEPTHIYDSENLSYFNALKEIRKHWKLIYKIATKNHKVNKVKYDKIGDFLKSLMQLKKYIQQIKAENSKSTA